MAKKKAKKKVSKKASRPISTSQNPWKKNHFLLAFGIAIFSFLLYANTLGHGYVLDDFSQIKENFVTKRGLSDVATHFTTHARYGYGRETGELYRPVTMATFSLDWELAPDKPGWAHFVNVFLYAILGGVFFLVLSRLLRNFHPVIPLLTTLFFMAHPTHVEVVANIKSRDEILMFLLCILSIHFLFNYLKSNKLGWMVASLLTYTVALFSKENAITFLAIFPLCMYFFSKEKLGKIAGISALFLVPAILFVTVRSQVIGGFTTPGGISVLDNFLVGAEGGFLTYSASAFLVLGRYLWVLFFPHPLVSDLGYNQMPLTGWGDWRALLSFALWAGIAVFAILRLRKKDLWSFGILFFLINFSIFTNLIITIGTSFGERLLFSASPGFALVLTLILMKIFRVDERKKTSKILENKALLGVAGVILLLYVGKTINRNADWKDSFTLYAADIEKSPNSAKLNYHYGLELVKKGNESEGQTQKNWYDQAKSRFQKAIEIKPDYHDAFGQMGLAFYREKNYEEALKNYELALKYRGGKFALVHSNMGIIYFERGDLAKAKECYEKAVQDDPTMVDALRNLGAVHAMQKNFTEAIKYFSQAYEYAPNDATINQYLGSAYRDAGQPEKGRPYLERAKQLGNQ
jgi:Flp pilus assembly protein TadD